MHSVNLYNNLVILTTLIGTSMSSPVDMGVPVAKKNDATLSGYRALSPPMFPYTPPMKPTRPYAFESGLEITKGRMNPSSGSKLSEIVSSIPDISPSKGIDTILPERSINSISQYYEDVSNASSNEKTKEKEEFIQVLRSLLWDTDEEENFIDDNESQGRQFGANYSPIGGGYAGNNRLAMQQQQNLLRWHGVLGRPMPQILKKQGLVGQAYRGFEDGCYKLACTLGINRLISQIGRMLG